MAWDILFVREGALQFEDYSHWPFSSFLFGVLLVISRVLLVGGVFFI
jgi:hypothetical protein